MRINADHNITVATLSMTNRTSFKPETNMQNFLLSRYAESTGNNTKIIADFGTDIRDINMFSLVGTNLSENATITIGYSNTDPLIPDATIPLPLYTEVNQVWFFDTVQQWRYWVIDISDPDVQKLQIGYLDCGIYTQINYVEFPSQPSSELVDNPTQSATGQPFGQKGYEVFLFSMRAVGLSLADKLLIRTIWQTVGRVEPLLLFMREGLMENPLNRPQWTRITNDTFPFALDGAPLLYDSSLDFREVF